MRRAIASGNLGGREVQNMLQAFLGLAFAPNGRHLLIPVDRRFNPSTSSRLAEKPTVMHNHPEEVCPDQIGRTKITYSRPKEIRHSPVTGFPVPSVPVFVI